ncbi:DNA gyrase subunit A [Pseudohongiella nitratireducens]|uniref:DNA gyrase subunit A n=1 Tax=Pseudohongiella nitratireducens TaxID=1768907 RepID=UPI00240968FF|nr:DNA gyrase subunit A [Pseudohongiella nitratireducens]MDF1623756.1 DNA gyrase subunit A [Pseudohongiella nitratireducens]|tara:strand:- start:4127 stop:6712 length:2586 start_codon:yes stop_codon:yes gene_type:complete
MTESTNQVLPVSLESEMRESYLAYAMSVIVGRALPDVRDGLKPVHRRVLYAMNVLNNDWNKPYKKSARVVGDVIGKYHPHGDSAVYDTIVRMAQDFSLRYPLVDGQGNFGSIDGDAAAAMRYTEIRMMRIAHDLMADLDKETVNFSDNYDGTEIIPDVFPTQIPNLLVNGSSGIAVGMATNIPPHNLGEVIDASLALLDNEDISIDELMEFVTGPDFPTAAIINGKAGIIEAYKTGRGRIYMRARAEIVEDPKNGRQTIIVTEIPYQLNKARLIEKIAELVKDKKIEGISELRDESDKDGLRIVIELRRGEVGEVVLNNLYAQTQMQAVFGINMVALVDGEPRLLNLKEILQAFLRHRREVVTRRTIYLLRKAREKGHILEGLAVALANIDDVIQLIKESPSSAEAKEKLLSRSWQSSSVLAMLEASGADTCRPEELPEEFGLKGEEYYLSPAQAQAILDLRLHRLTGLEHEKLINDYKELLKQIADFLEILGSESRLFEVLREEMNHVRDSYADERRTEIVGSQLDLTMEDLITQEDRVVTISRSGYAKSQPLTDYQAQRRGGMGKAAASVKDEDVVEHLLIANSHDTLLCFSSFGKVYWIRVFNIPIASRTSRGRPLVNILPLEEGEQITSMLPVNDYEAGHFIVMATLRGTIKKTPLENFSRPRSVGLRAIELDEGDRLIGTALTNGEREIMLLSSSGKAIRFKESDVRAMGRTARGVRGIKMAEGHEMISLIIADDEKQVLTVSEYGYGKRTSTEEFPVYGRGGQGVIAMQTSERNGSLVGAVQVEEGDQIMLISNKGTLVRTRVDEVSVLSRNTQGVRLIKLKKDETLVGIEQVADAETAELIDGADEPESGDSDE